MLTLLINYYFLFLISKSASIAVTGQKPRFALRKWFMYCVILISDYNINIQYEKYFRNLQSQPNRNILL